MRVTELKVGELYKIRSDRSTHVLIRHGYLDVHLGHGAFKADGKIRPMDHLVYLGNRLVNYRGKKLKAYPNIWQHIVPLDDDIP
jgi:hypothetical protein